MMHVNDLMTDAVAIAAGRVSFFARDRLGEIPQSARSHAVEIHGREISPAVSVATLRHGICWEYIATRITTIKQSILWPT